MNNDRPTGADILLNQATDALRDQWVPAGPDAELRERLLSTLNATELNSPATKRHFQRSTFMRILGLAASLLVFAAVIGWLVPGTGASDGAAFAQMLKQVAGVRSAVITTRAVFNQPGLTKTIDGTMHIHEPSQVREDQGAGDERYIMIVDMQRKQMLGLYPAKMTATRSTFEVQVFGKSTSLLQSFRELREDSATYLGHETIDGRETLEYHGRHPMGFYWLWFAADDHLPVKMEICDTPDVGNASFTQTLSDFRWNVPLDESLFSLEVPEGYTDVTPPAANDVPQTSP